MYSQKDTRWSNIKLGTGKYTVGRAGCYIVSLCNLLIEKDIINLTPKDMNELCLRKGFYANNDMLKSLEIAEYFKLNYKNTGVNPKKICIAETNHYASSGVPKHFFLLYSNNTIIDPLKNPATVRKNPYKIVSYRVFTKKDIPIMPVKSNNGNSGNVTTVTSENEMLQTQKNDLGAVDNSSAVSDILTSNKNSTQSNFEAVVMNKIMNKEKIKALLLSNPAKRVYWTTLNSFIGLAIVYFSDINWVFAPFIIGILNSITKEINKKLSA